MIMTLDETILELYRWSSITLDPHHRDAMDSALYYLESLGVDYSRGLKFTQDQDIYIVHHDSGARLGEILQGDDGYYIFYPSLPCTGFWKAYVLHGIALKMHELNKAWDKQVQDDPLIGE